MTVSSRLTAALTDRYRVERELGQGGMATVYLARDLRHQREVALKVLRPELAAVLGAERFLNEIRISAQLDHPHILTLIDSGADDTFLWYVLPYVRGESLRSRLTREMQLPVDDALQVTRQIAGALDYAHQRGVIHRDIKPENILLHEGEAVLADFGIALAVKEAGGNRLTETGLSLGTPQYMSPEQATGEQKLDARSDVYSLGAVLFEMLTGEPPHTGPTAHAVIAKLMTERPMRIRTVRDSVPEALDQAVAKVLSKVPADRYATAGAFAAAVTAASSVASTEAGATATQALARRRVRAGGVAAGIVLFLLTLLVARRERPRNTPFAPQLVQLTTDGNARAPALSPDGGRLAYLAHDCDQVARCTDRIVVKDTGGAGSITAFRKDWFFGVHWTTGGRFLVANGGDSLQFGTFAVPALGGAPRFLGCCFAQPVGSTDTVLISTWTPTSAGATSWPRFVTVSDGIVRDSLPIVDAATPGAPMTWVIGVPGRANGLVVLVRSAMPGSGVMSVVDRHGRVTDASNTRLAIPGVVPAIAWLPDDDGVVWLETVASVTPSPIAVAARSVVVRRRITADGRFRGPPDTLMTLPIGAALGSLNADGTAMLTQGPVDAVVHALERARPGSLDFRIRQLAASTAGLDAVLSRDGEVVWLSRAASEGSASGTRDAFVPFTSGTERPFVRPPGTVFSRDWARPVSSALLIASRDTSRIARVFEVSVASGQVREVGTMPASTNVIASVPGGGHAFTENLTSGTTRVVGRPGQPDTTWTAALGGVRTGGVSAIAPDGKSFLTWSSLATNTDTGWYHLTPLDGGATREVWKNYGGWIIPDGIPTLLRDGSIEFVLMESGSSSGWYRIRPGGVGPVRLGPAPIQGALNWSISDDGRRAIAVKNVDRPDAYIIRNFRDVLRRP